MSAAAATGLLMSFSMPEYPAKSLLHQREGHREHVHHGIDREGLKALEFQQMAKILYECVVSGSSYG